MDPSVIPNGLSGTFVLITLILCAGLVSHMIVTLWRNRHQLGHGNPQYHTITHSIPMTMGMVSTLAISTIGGAAMTSNLGTAYTLSFFLGTTVGILVGWPFQVIAVVDGVVAGVMGGLMGVMIGSMVPVFGIYALGVLLTALFGLVWFLMRRQLIHPLQQQPMVSRTTPRRHHGS